MKQPEITKIPQSLKLWRNVRDRFKNFGSDAEVKSFTDSAYRLESYAGEEFPRCEIYHFSQAGFSGIYFFDYQHDSVTSSTSEMTDEESPETFSISEWLLITM